MNTFAISAYQISSNDVALLKSLLELLADKTRASWIWVDDFTTANVVVIDSNPVDQLVGEILTAESSLHAAGSSAHPVFLSDSASVKIAGRLSLDRAMRVNDIIRCLDAAQMMMQVRDTIKLKQASMPQGLVWVEPHPDSVSVIDITSIDESGAPIQHHTSLYSAVASQYELRHEGVFSIRGRDWEPIYVLPARRQFLSLTDSLVDVHAGVERLRATLSQQSGSVVVEEVIDVDFLCDILHRHVEPGYRLIWLAAITLPPRFQTQYIDPTKAYLLKRSPNFSDLMHSEADLRMAAALTQTPLNARGLALLSGASIAGARSFLMACYASGLLMSHSHKKLATAHGPPVEHARANIIKAQ